VCSALRTTVTKMSHSQRSEKLRTLVFDIFNLA
jgi:hypothetical protein